MLAFLPPALYFLIAPVSVSLALWLAFAAAFALGVSGFGTTRTLRIFDMSGWIAFGLLALYVAAMKPDLSPAEAGLVVSLGYLAAILATLVLRRPFTTQYSVFKIKLDPAQVALRHVILSAAWAACFALIAATNAVSVILLRVSPGWAGVLTLALFASTLTFTWHSGAYIDKRDSAILLSRRR